MTTMITGAGLVGSQIARILVQQGEKPVLFDIAANLAALADVVEVDKVTLFRGDLLNPFDLGRVINENGITRIVHTAAYPNLGTGAQENPYGAIQVNIMGTANVLEAARLHGVERVVMISTAAVARGVAGGEDNGDRSKEEALPRPSSFYSATKQAGENLGYNYARSHGVDFRAVRFPNVCGPWIPGGGGRPSAMFRTLVEKSVDGVEHTIPPGTMEWLYSKDAARGVVLTLQAEGIKSRVFNLGVGRPYDNQELIDIFKQVVPGAKLSIDESVTTAQTSSVFLDITRAQTELGFDAEYDIPAAVTDFVGWYRRIKKARGG